jgi:hypothetical protein
MQKTKSIQEIEEQMQELDPASLRYRALDCARGFKNSWIGLGQALFSIYKDKHFKEWGYLTFEAYCAKEIGIRQPTALKLLKSYSFLEREEPSFLKASVSEDRKPSQIPSCESVNALRLVKENERVSKGDYQKIREDVFENAKEDKEVKQKIRYLLKSSAPALSAEEKEEKREVALGRILSSLRGTKLQLQEFSFPSKVIRALDELVDLLSEYQQ